MPHGRSQRPTARSTEGALRNGALGKWTQNDLGSSVSTSMHRRSHKIRRTGRHTTPSSVEKVAEKAGKAAPAAAIVGVLVAAPVANAATASASTAGTVAVHVYGAPQLRVYEGIATTTTHIAATTKARSGSAKAETQTQAAERTYTVQPGDTLASIAQRFYGNDDDWTALFHANESKVSNPNQIYPGALLLIPASANGAQATGHTPKHAKKSDPPSSTLTSSAVPSGTLSCGGLEDLWEDAGGSAGGGAPGAPRAA